MYNYILKLTAIIPQHSDRFDAIIRTAGILQDLIVQYPQHEENLTKAALQVKPNHLKWVAQQLENKEPFQEIIETIERMIELKQKINTDLYSYKTLGDLRFEIEQVGNKSKSKQKQKDTVVDAEIIYESPDYLVVHPNNKEASIYYGQGTRWCTAATKSKNYFEDYAFNNVFLYYIITRNPELLNGEDDPNSKIAYAMLNEGDHYGKEIFNKLDKKISDYDVSVIVKEYGPIMSKINSHIDANPVNKFKRNADFLSLEKFIEMHNNKDKDEEKRDFADKMLMTSNIEVIKYILNNNLFNYVIPYEFTKNSKYIDAEIAKILVDKKLLDMDILNNQSLSQEAFLEIEKDDEFCSKNLVLLMNMKKTSPKLIDLYIQKFIIDNKESHDIIFRQAMFAYNLTDEQFEFLSKINLPIPLNKYVKSRPIVSDTMIIKAFDTIKQSFYKKYNYPNYIKSEQLDENLYNIIYDSYEIIFDNTRGDLKKGNITDKSVKYVYDGLKQIFDNVNDAIKKYYGEELNEFNKDDWYKEITEYPYFEPFTNYFNNKDNPNDNHN